MLRWIFLGATGWLLLQAFGLLGPLSILTFPLLDLGAVVAIVVGVRRYRPAVRWPFNALAVGFFLFLVGGIARESFGTLGVVTSARSIIPDLITIPGYVITAAGLFGIVRARQGGRDYEVDTFLDAAVAALAATAIGWIFVLNPAELQSSPLSVRVVLGVYPMVSVFLVAIAASLAFSRGTKRLPANTYMLAAMVCVLIGDVVYAFVETHALHIPSNLIDLPYGFVFLFVIIMMLHPSMAQTTDRVGVLDSSPTTGRLVIVAVALAVPGIITVERVGAPVGDRVALAAIILALTAAAITRLFRAVKAHARSEARLIHQATHDMLTGLPNRAYVHQYIEQAVQNASPESSVALMFLDVDRFKLVNDSYGHSLGDAFLVAVGQRLRTSIRPTDLVARIGGDEFVVVASRVPSTESALEWAERIRLLFLEPFTVHGSELASSVSIGVALADGTNPADNAESMIRDADIAMYHAKESGRDAVAAFDWSMRDRVSKRLDLERDLHHALERDELCLYYQPVLDIASGRVTGFEALLRWMHPAWGLVSPLTFIPVAEETGLIVDIGRWAMGEACRQLAGWSERLPHGDELSVAVNVSARQFRNQDIVEVVRTALERSGLRRESLRIELTESTLMDDPAGAKEMLGRLKQIGVGLSIDDFGTGYSSLAYLRGFPVDTVKIDRAFVSNLDGGNSADATLVAAIVAMADALDISTVAEGVENETQASQLLDLGCSYAQGFLYAKPVPAEEIPGVVERLSVRARSRLRPVRDSYSA